jgi:hypothetical protein
MLKNLYYIGNNLAAVPPTCALEDEKERKLFGDNRDEGKR